MRYMRVISVVLATTLVLITVLCLSAGNLAIAEPTDFSAELVGYWKSDNPDDLGLDSSGLENNVTVTPGDVTYTEGGILNGAAQCKEGTLGAAIMVPHSDSLNLTKAITI